MEEDILTVIQRKRWTAEEKLKEIRTLAEKATDLPEGAEKNIPTFVGDWSEDRLIEFLEKLKESIKKPLRHKNRTLLEHIGVKVKGLPEHLFDDSDGIENISSYSEQIDPAILKLILDKQIINSWLGESIETTIENLKEIIDASPAFKRILENEIDKDLKEEILIACINQRDFTNSADEIISSLNLFKGLGIDAKYEGDLETFETKLRDLRLKLKEIEDEYKLPETEIAKFVKGKSLSECDEILKKMIQDYSRKKSQMQEEWKLYSSILKLLGHDIQEEPDKFNDLGKSVEELRKKSIKAVGKEGFTIIQFLKGEQEFPKMVSQEAVKKTLEILRPFFQKALKEEE